VLSFRVSITHIPLIGSVLLGHVLEAISVFYPDTKGWAIAAGTFYIIAGILSFWLAFTQVFNEYWRLNILPWWPYIYGPDNDKGNALPYYPKVDDHIQQDISGFRIVQSAKSMLKNKD